MDVNTEERYDDEWNESMGTELFIMKRSGERVPFDIRKIINAISKANSEMTNPIDKLSSTGISDIAESIFKQAQALDRDLSVEEIQDKVEDLIMVSGKCELARAYITYRYKHNEARKKSTLDKKIEGIINVKVNKDGTVSGGNEEVNQENSNKDTKVLSVQRDYMAGEWSRNYTRKHLLPPEVMTAHDLGIIHVHDTDYQAQPEHNCFSAKTEFITRNGVTTFANCKDGEIVEVLDKDGHWKKATVRYYGKQRLYDIILKAGNSEKKVVCTQNHRWILKDGTVTTNLKEGDSLYALHTAESFDLDINAMSNREKEMFVLGFIIGDGTDYKNGMKARLCNTKIQYAKIFEDCGYSTRPIKDSNDIETQKPCKLSKQKFLKSNGWRYLSSNDKEFLFKGFYAADGNADRNQVTTSNKQVLKMVCEISAIAGYHISSIDTVNHDTNFKENATLHVINFRIEQKPNKLWKVESIKYHRKGNLPQNVWCVEEPETHSFTLAGGIVTGNCCLINLEDMLQNGTCISGTWIDTPKSFSTATTVASQIIAQVASQQYGGQTISLAHLAPFVDVSRQKLRKRFSTEWKKLNIPFTEEQLNDYVEAEVRKEVESGCQTIQYQLITLQTTNGQAPFVTVFMYLNEARNEQEKKDLAMLIEVMLKQRMKGVKDASGAYITPAFPKLIYCLQEDNIREGTPYWYLTVLAAKCTAKRMVPDYISEKKMLELKGDVYPCMGCVDGKEVITYKYNNNVYTESFERMWDRLSKYFEIGKQPNLTDFVMKTPGVKIYDQKEGFVDNYGIIKNHNSEWLRITFSNGRTIMCTPDHPFETKDGRVVFANDLTENDLIEIDKTSSFETPSTYTMKNNRAWLYGFALCDSTYYDNFTASIAAVNENEIENNFSNIMSDEYGLSVNSIPRVRGKKGNYKDLRVVSNNDDEYIKLRIELIKSFEGKAKSNRHIPNEVFSWTTDAKLAFIAGMIDADGYLNTTAKKTIVQIGSTNKELAIQQALLAQTCGMFAKIYHNHYRANCKDKIRYRVEFTPTAELISCIKCNKKTDLNDSILENTNHSVVDTDTCYITNVEHIHEDGFSYDVTTSSEHFTVSGIYSHNCRSFLTPDRFTDAGIGNIANALNYVPGKHKYYGRFNQGVVTINLVDVACSSHGDEETFWKLMTERLELCHKALRSKHERLLGTPSDVAPIQWQYGALARLRPGEVIDPLLFNGYSTISLGYAGLAECVYFMKHVSHTSDKGKEFGLRVMQALNDACNKWKSEENIDYSVYGTPLESTTYKFAKCLQRRFGKIPHVTDKNYITNSYHVHVTEHIDAFSKLSKESEFQKLSPGGAISYVEVPNMQGNIPAVLAIIQHIYNTILYAELNTKSDHCENCGYDGEIKIIHKDGKLAWQCPQCGCTDQNKMHVARRTCGYIGTQYWNQGRTQEIAERVLHVAVEDESTPPETDTTSAE